MTTGSTGTPSFRPEVFLMEKLLEDFPNGVSKEQLEQMFTKEHFERLDPIERAAMDKFWNGVNYFVTNAEIPQLFYERGVRVFPKLDMGLDTNEKESKAECEALYAKMTAPITQKARKRDRFVGCTVGFFVAGKSVGSGALSDKSVVALSNLGNFCSQVNEMRRLVRQVRRPVRQAPEKLPVIPTTTPAAEREKKEDFFVEVARQNAITESTAITTTTTNSTNNEAPTNWKTFFKEIELMSMAKEEEATTTTTTTIRLATKSGKAPGGFLRNCYQGETAEEKKLTLEDFVKTDEEETTTTTQANGGDKTVEQLIEMDGSERKGLTRAEVLDEFIGPTITTTTTRINNEASTTVDQHEQMRKEFCKVYKQDVKLLYEVGSTPKESEETTITSETTTTTQVISEETTTTTIETASEEPAVTSPTREETSSTPVRAFTQEHESFADLIRLKLEERSRQQQQGQNISKASIKRDESTTTTTTQTSSEETPKEEAATTQIKKGSGKKRAKKRKPVRQSIDLSIAETHTEEEIKDRMTQYQELVDESNRVSSRIKESAIDDISENLLVAIDPYIDQLKDLLAAEIAELEAKGDLSDRQTALLKDCRDKLATLLEKQKQLLQAAIDELKAKKTPSDEQTRSLEEFNSKMKKLFPNLVDQIGGFFGVN